eukprot:GDKJ01026328.1.p1 GENE.GDKJ01026328.1~~GDKJ01026328.1.p1  ORF type:complete len:948 (+),score=279.01 GDKJ01026328.1:24-2846(+)
MGKELEVQLAKSKISIIQDTKLFDEATPNVSKCEIVATSILNLQSQGVEFTESEITDIFFRSSKLFRTKGPHLRRLVYLLMKSLPEEQAFIVTSSLNTDMNEKSDAIRANAIRAMGVILDATTAPMFERYIKTGIVEKNAHVAAAALACGIKFTNVNPDIVKRWITEVTQALESSSGSVQYLSLVLLHLIRKSDKLALHKLVMESTRRKWSSAAAEVTLIRLCSEVISSAIVRGQQVDVSLLEFLDQCCAGRWGAQNNKSVVQLEAMKILTSLVEAEGSSVAPSCETTYGLSLVNWLNAAKELLVNPSPAIRYGAIKVVARLSVHRSVFACRLNSHLEARMADENRTIAGVSLTILLKTVQPVNVDPLIKQMSHIMVDAPVSLKTEGILAVRSLCLQYPAKYRPIFSFINTHLREDGGVELKKVVVHTLMDLTEAVPEGKDLGLAYLCEYIEDCEFSSLCAKVISFIARLAPSCPNPSKFVRFIYNRILLENAVVRAAAVDALSRLAIACPSIRKDVIVLLETPLVDTDDEVRQRTLDYINCIKKLPSGAENKGETTPATSAPVSPAASLSLEETESLMGATLDISLEALCEQLLDHSATNPDSEFNFNAVPSSDEFTKIKATRVAQQVSEQRKTDPGPSSSSASAARSALSELAGRPNEEVAQELYGKVQSLLSASQLGALLATSRPQQLSEAEADFAVTCKKHFFATGFIVCELHVTNSLEDVHLRSVGVELSQFDGNKWKVTGCIPAAHIKPSESETVFVILEKKEAQAVRSLQSGSLGFLAGQFVARLRYASCDDEEDMEGFEDVYALEPLKISTGDYFKPRALKNGEFKVMWESVPAEQKSAGKALRLPAFSGNMVGAANFVIKALNMAPCDNCQVVNTVSGKVHALYLSGVSTCGASVLVFAQIAMHDEHGCLVKMTAGSKDKDTADAAVENFK